MPTDTARNNIMFDFLKNKGTFRICYLGGSITEGAGASDKSRKWATQITAYLNSLELGNTVFEEINAGIGGTDSAYGMMRLERDVISTSPDAVFIDFSLNDMALSDDFSVRMYEGIIRKLMTLPKTPYVICVGVVPNRECEFKTELHKKIAAHYGLQYIDVKAAINEAYGMAEPGVNLKRDALFRPDNTHPVEAGYDFYTEVIKNALTDNSFNKPCGAPMCADYEKRSGVFVNARNLERSGEWTEYGEGDWNEKNLGKKGSGMETREPGAALSVAFEGNAVMLCYRLDREGGKMRITLDGVSEVHDCRYETDNQPVTNFAKFSLCEGKHLLCAEALEGHVKIDFVAFPKKD